MSAFKGHFNKFRREKSKLQSTTNIRFVSAFAFRDIDNPLTGFDRIEIGMGFGNCPYQNGIRFFVLSAIDDPRFIASST